jgi:hypothetical protein
MQKYLFIIVLLILASSAYADEVQIRSDIGLILNSLGYQEHTDSQILGVSGNVDSSANPSFLAFQGQFELKANKRIYGIKGLMPISKVSAKETWKFNGAEYQYNDLVYAISCVDIYGGYEFNSLLGVLGGIRISRGEQTRENFCQNGARLNSDISTEIIDSFNIFTRMFGSNTQNLITFGYALEASYPLSVCTTNNLLSGYTFSSTGYSLSAGISIAYKLLEDSTLKLSSGFSVLHYDGTPWIVKGTQTAKWPTNNTQNFSIALSLISGF